MCEKSNHLPLLSNAVQVPVHALPHCAPVSGKGYREKTAASVGIGKQQQTRPLLLRETFSDTYLFTQSLITFGGKRLQIFYEILGVQKHRKTANLHNAAQDNVVHTRTLHLS